MSELSIGFFVVVCAQVGRVMLLSLEHMDVVVVIHLRRHGSYTFVAFAIGGFGWKKWEEKNPARALSAAPASLAFYWLFH
jgi:hypothetical protein